MPGIRRLIAQRHFAALLCVAALLLKLVVPPGYMIGTAGGHIGFELCSGIAPQPMAMGTAMHGVMTDHMMSNRAMPGHGGKTGHGADQAKAEPCAFAGVAAAMIGSTDPALLATLIAFVLALGTAPTALPAPTAQPRLRPPLRGPPTNL